MPNEVAVLRAALRANPEAHAKLRELAEAGKLKAWEPETEIGVIVAAAEHFGIIGARQALCGCGTVVWLSPSTQAMIIARGGVPPRIICTWCFHKELKDNFETQKPQ